MENLLSHIDEFYQSDEELTKRMEELAKVFLFRGYINVRNKYHIYPRTVEFYYHEELETIQKRTQPFLIEFLLAEREGFFLRKRYAITNPRGFSSPLSLQQNRIGSH